MERVKTFPTGFGERLKEERERLDLSGAELALMTGIHRNTQARYEKELTLPTPIYLSIVRTLGIDVNYLLLGLRDYPTAGQIAILRKERALDRAKAIKAIDDLERRIQDLKRLFAET
jgi:transcriptional regulator with XRE-family HTH domain